MHELAICQALIDAVLVIADEQCASSVSEIHVSVGPLSGVESALLKSAFPIAAAGTVAKTALLHLHEVPVRILCDSCGTESDVAVNRLVCSHCDNWRTRLISGDELLLQRVCLDREKEELNCNV
jgi:hydrogenase nickel incorporation protein HypA/HybF